MRVDSAQPTLWEKKALFTQMQVSVSNISHAAVLKEQCRNILSRFLITLNSFLLLNDTKIEITKKKK